MLCSLRQLADVIDSQPVVVVLGASPTGLYALRESRACGAKCAVLDYNRGPAMHSRYLDDRKASAVAHSECHALQWLDEFSSRCGGRPLLLATSDVFVEFIAKHHEQLSHRFALPGCNPQLALQMLDKQGLQELAEQTGVSTPRVINLDADPRYESQLEGVAFPCILKPRQIHRARRYLGRRKLLVVHSDEELRTQMAEFPGDVGGWLLQELIPGAESEITLFAAHFAAGGEVRQRFTARKLRQYPPGFGSASLVSSVPCAEAEEIAIRFLSEIGFRGVCGAEFKRDPRDGKLKLIEVNPRPSLWFQIANDAGRRPVESLVHELSGHDATESSVPQRPDVVWRYALKDMASRRFYKRSTSWFPLPAPDTRLAVRRPQRSWPLWSISDPLPSLVEPFLYLRKLIRR